MTIQDWLVGLAITAALPLVWKIARSKVAALPLLLVSHLKGAWQKKLDKKEVDADLDELAREWGVSLCRYVEKKLPDEGLGPKRMDLLMSLLHAVPYVGFIAKRYDKEFRELAEIFVKAMDAEAKEELKPKGEAPPV